MHVLGVMLDTNFGACPLWKHLLTLQYLTIKLISLAYKFRSRCFWPRKGLYWNNFGAFSSKASTIEGLMEHITTVEAVKFVESCKEGNQINFLEELIYHCVVLFNFKIILMICYICKVTWQQR